ncbi:MAG: hypothetical protein C3F17_15255 [Bradyrhizobiaceae bacterium]|nr:MAG: hypothetical protein C3F17_15255 [Bradyrhizobiaceae bacterium]
MPFDCASMPRPAGCRLSEPRRSSTITCRLSAAAACTGCMRDQRTGGLLAALAPAICLSALIWALVPGDAPAKLTLTVFVCAVIAWITTPLDRTAVALVAALSLVIGGADAPQDFYSSLGNPLIWLLVGAFVIARALTEIRLAERLASTALRAARSVSGLRLADRGGSASRCHRHDAGDRPRAGCRAPADEFSGMDQARIALRACQQPPVHLRDPAPVSRSRAARNAAGGR